VDPYSGRILSHLQRDGRLTVQELADRIGLSSTPTWKRLKELERTGVITRYAALLDRSKVGLGNCVLAEINLSRHVNDVVADFEEAVRGCEPIVACYATTGQADYLLKVVTPDVANYDAFLHSVVFQLPGVSAIRSSVVLREIKSDAPLPLNHLK
jgi:Lrp/AsnC family leucine-responsive transcriptional regulator